MVVVVLVQNAELCTIERVQRLQVTIEMVLQKNLHRDGTQSELRTQRRNEVLFRIRIQDRTVTRSEATRYSPLNFQFSTHTFQLSVKSDNKKLFVRSVNNSSRVSDNRLRYYAAVLTDFAGHEITSRHSFSMCRGRIIRC